jgi:hypothetical protein
MYLDIKIYIKCISKDVCLKKAKQIVNLIWDSRLNFYIKHRAMQDMDRRVSECDRMNPSYKGFDGKAFRE